MDSELWRPWGWGVGGPCHPPRGRGRLCVRGGGALATHPRPGRGPQITATPAPCSMVPPWLICQACSISPVPLSATHPVPRPARVAAGGRGHTDRGPDSADPPSPGTSRPTPLSGRDSPSHCPHNHCSHNTV